MIYFEEYDERLGRKVTHLSFHVGHGDEFIKEKKKALMQNQGCEVDNGCVHGGNYDVTNLHI